MNVPTSHLCITLIAQHWAYWFSHLVCCPSDHLTASVPPILDGKGFMLLLAHTGGMWSEVIWSIYR